MIFMCPELSRIEQKLLTLTTSKIFLSIFGSSASVKFKFGKNENG